MKHPAKYSPAIIDELRRQLSTVAGETPITVLDPFAGAGGVHQLMEPGDGGGKGMILTHGVELEPEWAAMHEYTEVGDATNLMWPTHSVNWIVTSPCYGNRMADKDMRDSVASTYMKALGREASEGSACHLKFPGPSYESLHRAAWREANRVAIDGMLLNVKDFDGSKQRQKAAGWHVQVLQALGMTITDIVPVETRHMKHGANLHRYTELVIRLEKA